MRLVKEEYHPDPTFGRDPLVSVVEEPLGHVISGRGITDTLVFFTLNYDFFSMVNLSTSPIVTSIGINLS